MWAAAPADSSNGSASRSCRSGSRSIVRLPPLRGRRVTSATIRPDGTSVEDLPARSDVATDNPVPTPPFWGSRIVRGVALADYVSYLDERATFHLLNLAREDDASVLITARVPPSAFEVELRDLKSRLRAVPVVSLPQPDDHPFRGPVGKFLYSRRVGPDRAGVR